MQVAIFGFCDIRNFTDLTEVLQEGVMSFVNTIAEIVHSEVHMHDGAANKNIGDAFLLVWKFRQGFTCGPLPSQGLPATVIGIFRTSTVWCTTYAHFTLHSTECCSVVWSQHAVSNMSPRLWMHR